jgi:hypothetical protein
MPIEELLAGFRQVGDLVRIVDELKAAEHLEARDKSVETWMQHLCSSVNVLDV